MSGAGTPALPFTGERLVPGAAGLDELYFEHIARYLVAAPLCGGARVLDLACGAGYGSYHAIRQGARQVVGIDRAEDAVRFARSRYAAPGLSYLVGDATDIPAADRAFDIVLSFETIEHVPAPERTLQEFARVLAPDGALVISTPNPARYGPGGFTGQNPFHLREWSFAEFRTAVSRHFPQLQCYGQQAVQGQLVWGDGDDPACRHTSLRAMDARGVQPAAATGPDIARATFFLAVCSRGQGKSRSIPTWICSYPTDILSAVRGYAIRLQQERDRLRQQFVALAAEGSRRVQAGEMSAGIALLEAAAQAEPGGPALPNLAVAYAMAGQTQQAERAFRQALACHPEDALLREDAAVFFRQHGMAGNGDPLEAVGPRGASTGSSRR
jgi:hypothetical protein